MTTTTKTDKVLSLKNDYLFKAVYGSDDEHSKFILISLLNKILNRTHNPITDIEYTNPFCIKTRRAIQKYKTDNYDLYHKFNCIS